MSLQTTVGGVVRLPQQRWSTTEGAGEPSRFADRG